MSIQLYHPLGQDCGSGERSNTQINHCHIARVFPEIPPVLHADVHSSLHLTVQPGVSGGPRDHHGDGDHQHGGRRLQQPHTVCQSQQRLVRQRISPLLCLLCDGLAHQILLLCSWVICEHSNYRGRQFFLEPIEITNWLKFSSLQTVGSLFPVRQVSFMYIVFCLFVLVWFLQTAINLNVQKHLTAKVTTDVVTFAWWLMEVLTLATYIF